MRTDIGRFLEGRLLETVNLIKAVYDLACGEGPDVEPTISGRELVFTRAESKSTGFLRVLPHDTWVSLAFPRGPELFDPAKKLRGYPRATRTLALRSTMDLDPYVRRMIDQAYVLDEPQQEEEDDEWG